MAATARYRAQLAALLVAIAAILVGTTTFASASTTSPLCSSSRINLGRATETRVGVASTPIGLFVGPSAPGIPVFIGEIGCDYDGFVSGSCVATETGVEAGAGGKGAPKPSPDFETPTNAPQDPPNQLKPGHNVRVTGPTEQYPDGYWVETNAAGQPIDPSTGKPPSNVTRAGSRARTHVPLPPK